MILRILHAPTTVGGNPSGLSKAEKALGYQSCTAAINQNYFQYPVDKIISQLGENVILQNVKIWSYFFKALLRYNVFHFNFGRSLAPIHAYPAKNYPRWKTFLYSDIYSRFTELLDAKIAKAMGKVVAFTYQGDDARQGDFCRNSFTITTANEVEDSYYTPKSDELKRKRIRKVEKISDLIYSLNPDLMHVLPARTIFVPYASVDPRGDRSTIARRRCPNASLTTESGSFSSNGGSSSSTK